MPKIPTPGEMWWIYDEENKKKKKKDEELKKEEVAKLLKMQKQKEKISKSVEANEELSHLKDMVEKWVVSSASIKSAKQAASDNSVESQETQDILKKIDSIQENEYMKTYIPKDLFLSKDEYKLAIKDPKQRTQTLQKVDAVLWILAQHINPTSRVGINIFSSFALFLLDKNLIKAQEDHIDIKYSLKQV